MGFRILVIEDNPESLELMTYLLTAFGHSASGAASGESGLDMTRRDRPELIICDIQLPGMNGYQVAQALQADETLARIPRIAVTALAMVGDRERILAAGFDGYIAKPIVPEAFVPEVERFLPAGYASAPAVRVHSAAAPAAIIRRDGNGKRILVVDDVAVNVQLARDLLENIGYDVTTVNDAKEALSVARRVHPDLVLSDVNMATLSGFELIRQLKADSELRAIPVIFLSATFLGEEARRTALKLGASRYLQRPLELEVLVSEIAAVLKKS
jgi:two-component system, cell cycle response regulator